MPRRKRARRNGKTFRPVRHRELRQDVGIGTLRKRVSGHQIPEHTERNKVQRIVRLSGQLTPSAPLFTISPDSVSSRDALDYLNSSAVLRYLDVRLISVKVWLESAAPTLSQPSFGVRLVDFASGTTYQTRPVSGQTYAAVGCQLCLETRSVVFLASDPTVVAEINSDITIPVGASLYFVCDVLCEFT